MECFKRFSLLDAQGNVVVCTIILWYHGGDVIRDVVPAPFVPSRVDPFLFCFNASRSMFFLYFARQRSKVHRQGVRYDARRCPVRRGVDAFSRLLVFLEG